MHYMRVYRILKRNLKKRSLLAVISRNTTFLPYLAKLTRKYNIKTYFEAHDFYADLTVRDDVSVRKKHRYSQIEKKYIPLISGIICLQNSQKTWYQRTFPQQTVFVARTGIDTIHRYPFHNRRSICYIGSFDPHKGLDTLLEALKYSQTKPHLFIIGGKNEVEIVALQKLISALYDHSRVTLTGWVNKDHLNTYLKQTAIGILPLKDTFFNRFITSPLKLFDYYSYGIPVVASDLPTTRELIQENETGLFFQCDNSKDLAQKIDYLISNRKIMENMNRHIYHFAENFLWKHRAQSIIDTITHIK
ncbi:MAG: glycosyltransferase [Gemmatimonadota bacterium]|nr:MAG: glycosyltransferase [Gemmatimonadota bacterium]